VDPDEHGEGPHQGQPLVAAGAPLAVADAAAVLVHGRGATANGIVATADEFYRHGVALLAPQAARNTWYPTRFTAPVEANEPGRSSGLRAIASAIETANRAGVPTDRVLVFGFSQGACLASEFVAHTPTRYGGLAAVSGGLLGTSIDLDGYTGDLERTPTHFGCSDDDPYVPVERVHESAAVFERLNADVTTRLYEGSGHSITDDDIAWVSARLDALVTEADTEEANGTEFRSEDDTT
jgi:phospholipase/carboxylesterase